MNARTHTLAAAVVGFAIVAGARADAAADWTVTSSIADGATLAKPIQWEAQPAGNPPGGLDRVEFLIDGTVRWIEHNPPFVFNNDGNYLYPYLLGRGHHQLIARAVARSGEQADATADVQVTQATPHIPRTLQATWKQKVSHSRIQHGSVPGDPPLPAGVYRLKLGGNGVLVATPPPGPATTGDEAFMATARGRIAFGGSLNWLTAQSSADGICHGTQSFSRYRWRIRHRTMTLKVVKDPCRLRAAIMAGHWTRAQR
jgi:hypothetical protein